MILKPKPFSELLSSLSSDVFELMGTYQAVDSKGRYLHWHEFVRRVGKNVNKEAAWAAVKFARSSGQKNLSLVSESDSPFKIYMTDYAFKVIHDIEQLSGRLGGVAGSSTGHGQNTKYLVDSLMMEEAISSAQLEGASTTRKVAKEMLVKERTPKNDDERMIFNNYMLMRHAKYNKDEPLTLDLMCEFHKIATMGVKDEEVNPGQFRELDDIFVGGRDGEVAHQPPQAEILIDRLEKLCAFANEAHDGGHGRLFIHPVVKSIILHFMIGYEHPFRDGNGRTARCLFYWFMLKSGYWAFEYISISALLKQAPVQYGESYLFTETDDFDLTYFILYQLKIIERAVSEFIKYYEDKKREFYDLMDWLDKCGISKTLNYRQGDLLKKIIRNPGRIFISKELLHDYDVSENTARKDLEGLVELKALAKIKEGKSYLYVARSDAADNLKRGNLDLKVLIRKTQLSGLNYKSI
jgi:Fic family protein